MNTTVTRINENYDDRIQSEALVTTLSEVLVTHLILIYKYKVK